MFVRTLTRKIINGLVGALLFILLFVLLQYLYWQVFPYKTADVAEPMIVLNENREVKPGENLKIEVTFTKYTDVTPTVSRNIFCLDNTVHFPIVVPIIGTARPVGTYTAFPEYGLPESVPKNTLCFFQFTNEYEVNAVRTIRKVWRSESFIRL